MALIVNSEDVDLRYRVMSGRFFKTSLGKNWTAERQTIGTDQFRQIVIQLKQLHL
ncbi:hypothetical protein AAULR_22074, partial [Lacticaseibacillus rhamnosus MTCC 5462]